MTTLPPQSSGPFQPAFRPVPPPPTPEGGMALVAQSEESYYSVPQAQSEPEPTLEQNEESKPVSTKPKRKRLNPDSLWTLGIAVTLVFMLIAASFIASFAAIYDVAEYTGVPAEWRWVFPVFIDIAIAAYTISLFIFRANKRPILMTMIGLLLFASLSVLANVAHVLAYWDGTLPDYRAWIGVALAASAPIGVLLASEEIARLAFVQVDEDE